MGEFMGGSKVKNRFFKTHAPALSIATRIRFEKTEKGKHHLIAPASP
jgi:hypothetical protein